MIDKLPKDIDPHNPMCEKPFWQWLKARDGHNSVFHKSLIEYTGLDAVPLEERRGTFTPQELDVYKHTHAQFWFLKLRGLEV